MTGHCCCTAASAPSCSPWVRCSDGFSHATLGKLHGKLSKLKTAKSPFPVKVKDEAVTTWVRPLLVAEVKFAEWTSKSELRQPAYLGLRSDKKAIDVVRERQWSRK